MPSIIPNSDAFNWIIGPAADCVLQIGGDIQRYGLVQRAVSAVPFHEKLLEYCFAVERSQGKNTDELVRMIIPLRDGLSAKASELMEDDFGPINRQMLISLWVAIEVAIEDTVLLILTKDAAAVAQLGTLGVKKLKFDALQPLGEIEASMAFDKLERHFQQEGRKNNSSVAKNYCDMLLFLGIPLKLPEALCDELSEIGAVRHCLLHRNGVADLDAVRMAPSLSLQLGEKLKISSEHYRTYFQSVAAFATAFLEAVMQSPYVLHRDQNSSAD